MPGALVEGLVPAVARLDWQLLGLVVFLGVFGGGAAFLFVTRVLSMDRIGEPAMTWNPR